ncbi:MAG: hypothetical protein Alis3KO_20100 [Aliiglaciecola sp.]
MISVHHRLNPGYNTLIKQTFPIIVVISILTGVYFLNNLGNNEIFENHCYLEGKSCTLKLVDSEVTLNFEQYPIVIEEVIKFSIEHNAHFVLQKGWVEGTNMFMGKTNLAIGKSVTLNNAINHQIELFLGACSEPRMRWKLVLDLTDVRTGQEHQVSVFFQTNYN